MSWPLAATKQRLRQQLALQEALLNSLPSEPRGNEGWFVFNVDPGLINPCFRKRKKKRNYMSLKQELWFSLGS